MQWPEYDKELLKRFQKELQPETGLDNLESLGDETAALISMPVFRTILKANRDLAAENESLRTIAAPRRRSGLAGLLLAGAFLVGMLVARRRK